MLQTYNIPPGGRQVNAKARFFRYESVSGGVADESLRVRADGNDLGSYLPGDSISLPADAVNWELLPSDNQARALVRLGVGGVGSSRVFGTVSVIDGERNKVLAGKCYRGGATQAGGGGGNPTVELFNQAGSGQNLFVQAVRAGFALADAYGVATTTTRLPTAGGSTNNLRRGGPAAVSAIYTDNTGTALVASALLVAGYAPATTDSVILFPRPVMLAPGEGILAYGLNTGNTVRCFFEWEEWPI
jgi:hypothetical protein